MGILKELYSYRQMIFSLVKRDLRGRYKGSVFGFLWTFLNPLLQLVVYTFVFSFLLKSDIENYYLFLFVALIPWLFFSTAITGGAGCVLHQSGMVTKIYFPREVLPISHVTSAFINMLYSFIVVFLVIFLSGTPINPVALLYLPIIMLVEYFLALGITLIASAVTVYFRDMEFILGIFMMAWQYLTPVMYSVDIVPQGAAQSFHAQPHDAHHHRLSGYPLLRQSAGSLYAFAGGGHGPFVHAGWFLDLQPAQKAVCGRNVGW